VRRYGVLYIGLCLWCAVVLRYGVMYIGDLCVVTVVCYLRRFGVLYIAWFVRCDCGVLLFVRMGYCILGGLCVVSLLSCCASGWGTL